MFSLVMRYCSIFFSQYVTPRFAFISFCCSSCGFQREPGFFSTNSSKFLMN